MCHNTVNLARVEGLYNALFLLCFLPSQVKICPSQSYLISPKEFDLGKVDCISFQSY